MSYISNLTGVRQILSLPKPRTNGKVIEKSINRKVKNRLQSRFFLSLNKLYRRFNKYAVKSDTQA